MPFSAQDVVEACKDLWAANQGDCSAFVRAVGHAVEVDIEGDADEIVALLSAGGIWTALDDGVAASAAAAGGQLVVGGLTAAEIGDGATHGHVVVVIPPTGALAFGKYPFAYWGSLAPGEVRTDGGLGKTVNWSFRSTVRDDIHYASTPI
jgi:hypothetical protein